MALSATQKDILTRFTSSAERLEAAVQGLSDSQLDLSLAPGEWTIRIIVHHVAEDGDVWSMHIKRAIATPGAPIRFEGFPGNEAWAEGMAYAKRPIENDLKLIRAHHEYLAAILEYFSEAWDRCVTILDSQGKEVQKFSAGEMAPMLANHMLEHVQTIEAIRQKHGLA